jgi:XisI protein
MVRKIKKYQRIIENFLNLEAQDRQPAYSTEYQVIEDTKNHHYQLIETGWEDTRYIYRTLFHLDIKVDGKVWLLINNTDVLVAEDLVKKGIPANDIVLGFQPLHVRPYTGFAVA